jgi:hypothetical protein
MQPVSKEVSVMRMAFVLALLLLAFPTVTLSADVDRFDVPIGSSPQRGPQDAAVTIIEFLDFQ